MTNEALLADFRAGSKQAFERLVARHIDWVYSAVLRQVRGDAHLADDVTQTVFILLAKKGPSLDPAIKLEAWLFNVARYASLEALRARRRREAHEKKAAAMAEMTTRTTVGDAGMVEESEWSEIAPRLDELVARLGESDRECVLMRFYQRLTFPQIGERLGISEEAARKRVERAVEKLRGYFQRTGVVASAGGTGGAAGLGLILTTHTTHAASASAVALCAAPGTATAVALANATVTAMSLAKLKAAGLVAASLLIASALTAVVTSAVVARVARAARAGAGSTRSIQTVASTTSDKSALPAPRPAGFPYAKGWPLALPGVITGTPALADLEGNGTLAIIVPCIAQRDVALAHPAAGPSAQLFALHADGTPVPGWPVELVTQRQRIERAGVSLVGESWYSSPSIGKDAGGRTCVVTTVPYVLGTRVISADGKILCDVPAGRQWTTIPLADLNGDGSTQLLLAGATFGMNSGKWLTRATREAQTIEEFGACVGDADGDGIPEIYRLAVGLELNTFDPHGNQRPGWPRTVSCGARVEDPHEHIPVMGDITGDGRMEIVVATEAIWAFTCDGKPLLRPDGIFAPKIDSPYASPSLADLDGDGKAEVIVFDYNTRAIRAWHGDGKPFVGRDGIVAHLPAVCRGVSIADLGGDGIIDLFAGCYWIKLDPKTGKSEVIAMAPDDPVSMTQPTIADVDGDGMADVIFGLQDGRLFIYNTGLRYQPQWVQWATASGNFQHTGVWQRPEAQRSITGRILPKPLAGR